MFDSLGPTRFLRQGTPGGLVKIEFVTSRQASRQRVHFSGLYQISANEHSTELTFHPKVLFFSSSWGRWHNAQAPKIFGIFGRGRQSRAVSVPLTTTSLPKFPPKHHTHTHTHTHTHVGPVVVGALKSWVSPLYTPCTHTPHAHPHSRTHFAHARTHLCPHASTYCPPHLCTHPAFVSCHEL